MTRSSPPPASASCARTGNGVAFLDTVSRAGAPRVHPVAPVLSRGRLYVFVVSMSRKHADLLRDGRYALHALPTEAGGEEFYVIGRAQMRDKPSRRSHVTEDSGGRLGHNTFETLFELDIGRVLYTRWSNWGTRETWPHYHRWP